MRILKTRRADEDLIEVYAWGAASFGVAQAEACHAGLAGCFEGQAEVREASSGAMSHSASAASASGSRRSPRPYRRRGG